MVAAGATQLLPVAADDEQAVVDGQPEPESGGEVDGVHRHVGHQRQGVQHRQGGHDGDHPHEQRQRRRHRRPEHQQEAEGGDREGDALGPAEVRLDRAADLLVGGGDAGDGHRDLPVGGGELVGRAVGVEPVDGVVVLPGDAGQDQRPVAGLRPQRRGAAEGPVAGGVGDLVVGGEPGGEGPSGRGHRRVVDHAALGGRHDQHQVGVAGPEPLGQQPVGLRRLGGRVGEPAALHGPEHAAAEEPGHDQQQRRRRQHRPPPPHHCPAQTLQHRPRLPASVNVVQ